MFTRTAEQHLVRGRAVILRLPVARVAYFTELEVRRASSDGRRGREAQADYDNPFIGGQRPSQVSMIVRRRHGSRWGAVNWISTVVSGEVSTGLFVAPGL